MSRIVALDIFLHLLKFYQNVMMPCAFNLERIEFVKTQYLSPEIQNSGFIEIMSGKVKESIIEKVKQAQYFPLMVDSTPDISHQNQISLIIRYLM